MSKGKWVECSIKDATHVLVNGHSFQVRRIPGARVVFGNPQTRVHVCNLNALGIKLVRWEREEPIDMVLRWAWRDSKGRIELTFELPYGTDEKFIDTIKGDKFRLIEVLDGE